MSKIKLIDPNFGLGENAPWRVEGTDLLFIQPRPEIGRIESDVKSVLGTDVVGSVVLRAEEYEDYRRDTVVPPFPIIIRAAVCRAVLRKNVVRTAIQGRPGEVKEFIATGDYDVTIRGTITNSENPFADSDQIDSGYLPYERESLIPVEQIAFMSRWVETDTVVQIENEYLNALGITDIIILAADFPQRRGEPGTFDFAIQAVSERFQDFVIIDPNNPDDNL